MGTATGTFQTPAGSPIANGLYQWKLSADAINTTATAATVPRLISGGLDANGSMTAVFAFNDILKNQSGFNTTYQLTVKDSGGGQVWNEKYFLSGASANVNLILPLGTGGGGNSLSLNDSVQTMNSTQPITFAGGINTFIKATAGASGITLSLPVAAGVSGQTVKVIMMDTGPGAVTLTGTIALRTNYVLSNQGQFVQLESDNSNFTVVGGN